MRLVELLTLDFGLVDALDAECALLHYSPRPNRDVGVELHSKREGYILPILEVIETPYFERAIAGAVSRPHAAIVRHVIEPLGAV